MPCDRLVKLNYKPARALPALALIFAHQIAQHKAREGKGEEQRQRDHVELPALRVDLALAELYPLGYGAYDEVASQQLGKAQPQRLDATLVGQHQEDALAHERHVGKQQRQAQHQKNVDVLIHAGELNSNQQRRNGVRAKGEQRTGE